MGRTDAVSYDFPEMGDLLSFDNTRRLSSLRDTARAATRQGGVGPALCRLFTTLRMPVEANSIDGYSKVISRWSTYSFTFCCFAIQASWRDELWSKLLDGVRKVWLGYRFTVFSNVSISSSFEFWIQKQEVTTQILYCTAKMKRNKELPLKKCPSRLPSLAACRGHVVSSLMKSCPITTLHYLGQALPKDLLLSEGDHVLTVGNHTLVQQRWGQNKLSSVDSFLLQLSDFMILYIKNRQLGTVLSLYTPFSLRPEIFR